MLPAVIEGFTNVIGRPVNWTAVSETPCSALHIKVEEIGGVQFMRSAWEPSPVELGWMLCGSKAALGVAGSTHPVVNLGITAPPENIEPVYVVRRIVNSDGPAVKIEAYTQKGWAYAEQPLNDDSFHHATAEGMKAINEYLTDKGMI